MPGIRPGARALDPQDELRSQDTPVEGQPPAAAEPGAPQGDADAQPNAAGADGGAAGAEAVETPAAFDWSTVPWDQVPDDVQQHLLKLPVVDREAQRRGDRRAQGTLNAAREASRVAQEAADRAAAQEREDAALRRAHDALQAVKVDPLASTDQVDQAAEALGQTIQARDAARRQRDDNARAEALRREGYEQAVGREIASAQQAAPLRIQERMDALRLPKAEQDQVWDEIERAGLPMGNLDQIATAIEHAHSLAFTRYSARELERQAQPVREQAAKSARAQVHGATQVDPSAGATAPSAKQLFVERALQTDDDKEFDRFWQAHKKGHLAV